MNVELATCRSSQQGTPDRCSRLDVLLEPMGYVDGENLYEFVGGDPADGSDPSGLYKIDWHKGSNWTDAEKQRINDSLQRVKARADALVPQIDTLIADLKKRKCDMSGPIKELENLKEVMKKESAGISSTKEKLEFVKKPFNPDAPLQDNQYRFGTNNIEFNTVATKTWDKLDQATLDTAMMHELSHEYGTEDDTSKGELMYAHTLDKLMNYDKDISRFATVRKLIMDAEKRCGCKK